MIPSRLDCIASPKIRIRYKKILTIETINVAAPVCIFVRSSIERTVFTTHPVTFFPMI